MKQKDIDNILAVWFIVGMFALLVPVAIVADHFDFAINGARMFSVDDNPLVDVDEIEYTQNCKVYRLKQKG